MASKVGKTIGDDLMRMEPDSLVYAGWAGEDTVQTADYLTIIDDKPIKEWAVSSAALLCFRCSMTGGPCHPR
jgi:hypothetical protein